MPTKPVVYRYRTWSVKCQDWTLHEKVTQEDGKDVFVCKQCGEVQGQVFFKDIPREKLEEQRERFKASETKGIAQFYNELNKNPLVELFRETNYTIGYKVIESDAGYNELRKKRTEERNNEIAFRKEEIVKYKFAERNTPCLCGSGKKYKKCCFERINSYYYLR